MAVPLSPRTPPPRLTSTVVAQWGTPRQEQSRIQARALIQGFTMRAGPVTLARLRKGFPIKRDCGEILREKP